MVYSSRSSKSARESRSFALSHADYDKIMKTVDAAEYGGWVYIANGVYNPNLAASEQPAQRVLSAQEVETFGDAMPTRTIHVRPFRYLISLVAQHYINAHGGEEALKEEGFPVTLLRQAKLPSKSDSQIQKELVKRVIALIGENDSKRISKIHELAAPRLDRPIPNEIESWQRLREQGASEKGRSR
jgi:hypothetical protein